MLDSLKTGFGALLVSVVLTGTLVNRAQANGPIGEHVHDLKAHLEEYSAEVDQLQSQVAGMVSRYRDQGQEGVDTQNLIEWWEAVKFHAAIETNHIPLYAAIWQGLYGVKGAIDEGKPAEQVAAEQRKLEQALWQSLGAVKLAASKQKAQAETSSAPSGDDVMAQIFSNLEEITNQYTNGAPEAATELVHSTYANLFEGVEGTLIEQDADLVESLEKDFNVALPQALKSGPASDQVEQTIAAMKKKLRKAEQLLEQARENQKDVF